MESTVSKYQCEVVEISKKHFLFPAKLWRMTKYLEEAGSDTASEQAKGPGIASSMFLRGLLSRYWANMMSSDNLQRLLVGFRFIELHILLDFKFLP